MTSSGCGAVRPASVRRCSGWCCSGRGGPPRPGGWHDPAAAVGQQASTATSRWWNELHHEQVFAVPASASVLPGPGRWSGCGSGPASAGTPTCGRPPFAGRPGSGSSRPAPRHGHGRSGQVRSGRVSKDRAHRTPDDRRPPTVHLDAHPGPGVHHMVQVDLLLHLQAHPDDWNTRSHRGLHSALPTVSNHDVGQRIRRSCGQPTPGRAVCWGHLGPP